MSTPGRSKTPLNRARVVLAAVAHADAHGTDGLTMRSLAGVLGVAPMALYRHVAHKEDLIDGMVDVVFAEMELPSPAGGWKASMRRRAVSARQVLARHRWSIPLLESRTTPGPANMRHHDAVLAVLLDAGFTGATATRAFNVVDSYIYGFVLQETNLPFGDPDELSAVGALMLEHISAEQYPHLVAVA
ncbi:MAG: TetR/AcrR family transcriptional regulator, partial [Aldersonia sp.]|nr:TetR/AcrR family transcriptional regulator [Aldersonia sp.]